MSRSIKQNASDLDIALMRMNQARDRLADAIVAGHADTSRLENVHAAAIADYRDLIRQRRDLCGINK